MRNSALVVGVCSAVALSVTGVSQQRQALAAPASLASALDDSVAGGDAGGGDPVVASGRTPALAATVVAVNAPYSLPTNAAAPEAGQASPANPARATTITLDEARAGTVWTANSVVAGNCTPSVKAGRDGLTGPAAAVMDCIAELYPQLTTYYGVGSRAANSASDHPNGRAVDAMIDNWDTDAGKALGWDIANYVAANAEALNVKYVIWDAQIFIPGSGWRGYRHPSGATDPNSAHLNHVHVSVRN